MSTMADTKGRRGRRSFTDDDKTGAVRLVLDEAEREELARLRKDVRELRMERDVLKNCPTGGTVSCRDRNSRTAYAGSKTVASAARDLGVTESSLRNWVEQARADRTKGKTGLTTAEREELARLRKDVRELRMERDVLKKAAAFFARDHL